MNSFDIYVFHLINHLAGHNPLFDALMTFFAQYALELYAVLFVVAWFALPRKESSQRHALVISVLAGIVALLVNVVISHFWIRSRPFVSLSKGEFTQLIPHSNDASFPSDHASGSFAFAAATWGKASTFIRYSFTILAVVVAFARVYCGVHWPTDVIGSFVVGTLSARLVWKLSRYVYPLTRLCLRLFRFGPYANAYSGVKNESRSI